MKHLITERLDSMEMIGHKPLCEHDILVVYHHGQQPQIIWIAPMIVMGFGSRQATIDHLGRLPPPAPDPLDCSK